MRLPCQIHIRLLLFQCFLVTLPHSNGFLNEKKDSKMAMDSLPWWRSDDIHHIPSYLYGLDWLYATH